MAKTQIVNSDWYSLANAESNINAIEDAKVRADATEVANILHSIDNSAVGIAYHLNEINTKIKGKAFEAFCLKYFGIKKAQAFNYSTAGEYVTRVFDESGKKSIYIDNFTLEVIQKDSKMKNADGSTNWAEYYKAVKKARSFGMTQILNIATCIAKTTLGIEDVVKFVEIGAISPNLSVKRITEFLMGKFKAIEQTTKDNKDKDKDGQTDGQTIEIPIAILNAVYPELCRYSEDAPEIQKFIEFLKTKSIMG